jgi:hypothetical protein
VRVSRRADPERGADANGAVGGSGNGCAEAVVPARPAGGGRAARQGAVSALAGFREPVVWILLAIAFFTWISGKPVDGVLMLIVAAGLAWDAGRRAREGRPAVAGPADGVPDAGPAGSVAGLTEPGAAQRTSGRRRLLVLATLLIGAAAYAGVMGSFIRYSWPATAGIIILGTVVVLIGWHGPLRRRQAPGRLPAAGTLAWVVVLVFGCLWELAALLLQPSITTDSYAHPTISTLTDPVLATSPGRSLVLAAWLAVGWYLVER